jgi:hypothetical protein
MRCRTIVEGQRGWHCAACHEAMQGWSALRFAIEVRTTCAGKKSQARQAGQSIAP